MESLKSEKDKVCGLVLHQLSRYWPDIDKTVIETSVSDALEAVRINFECVPDKRFHRDDGAVIFPYMSVQWMIFLYRLSRAIFKNGGVHTPKEADMVYYLNKAMHANDWFYEVDLPPHFLCEHPLGSVLGRAEYGDFLVVYQGTTVGGNRRDGKLFYPVLGSNVVLYANATVLGDTCVGNNVIFSADSYVMNERIPDNCIVFGKSPGLVIKEKSENEMKAYTAHIWDWRRFKG